MLPPRPPSYCRNDRVRLLIPNQCFFFLFFAFKFEKTDSSSTSYIIAVSTLQTGPRYFSLFLMLGGLFGSYNVALAVSINHPIPWSIKKTKKKKTNLPTTSTVDLFNISSSSRKASSCLCYHQQFGVCPNSFRGNELVLALPSG